MKEVKIFLYETQKYLFWVKKKKKLTPLINSIEQRIVTVYLSNFPWDATSAPLSARQMFTTFFS